MKDIIFLHNPKTGGETIGGLLQIRKNHCYAKMRIKEMENKYSFTFVRHPVDRMISWYNHLKKHMYFQELEKNELSVKSECYQILKQGYKMGPDKHRILAENNNINDWIKIMLSNPKEWHNPFWGPLSKQYNYSHILKEVNGKKEHVKVVSDIFYFENYVDELKKLLKKVDRHDLIPKIMVTNNSRRKNTVVNEESIKLIQEYFKLDYELLGYPFDIKS